MRDDSGWHIFNQGVEPPMLKIKDVQGGVTNQELNDWENDLIDLNAIDGSSIADIYAVGKNGIVIHRTSDLWRKLPKITNVNLRRIRVVDEDVVFIVGDSGVLLKGNAKKGFSAVYRGQR